MDYFGEMKVLQDKLGDLARQNNEQALDLIQLTSKVSALASGGSGGGGIDLSGMKALTMYDTKSSNSFSTGVSHSALYSMIGTLQPNTTYLVAVAVNIISMVNTSYDADVTVSGLFNAVNSGTVTYYGNNRVLDGYRVTSGTRAAQVQRIYPVVFIMQLPDFSTDPDVNPGAGSFQAQFSVGGTLHDTTTALSSTHGSWAWRSAYGVAIPIATN